MRTDPTIKMRLLIKFKVQALVCFVLANCANGQVLDRFESVTKLASAAEWVGIVRIERFVQDHGKDAIGLRRTYQCTKLLSYKNDASKTFRAKLFDCRARADVNARPVGDLFHVGGHYLIFVTFSNDHLATSLHIEGAVLPVVDTLHYESLRGLELGECFRKIVEGQEKYYLAQSMNASAQARIFLRGDKPKEGRENGAGSTSKATPATPGLPSH